MRVRNIPNVDDLLRDYRFFVNMDDNGSEDWRKLFKNNNPIHVEIGMGKGQFLIALAKANPDINYIGIEKSGELLFKVAKSLEKSHVDNILLSKINALAIDEYFNKGEISRIYLNFSDPWPKNRHEKRRLTAEGFLNKYKKILKKRGEIHFKTDSLHLFQFSLEEMRRTGFFIDEIYYDLHNNIDGPSNNITTEYEERFIKMGKAIYKCIAINIDGNY